MKMSRAVEWALHCCLDLALLPPGAVVPSHRLAAYHAVPTAYLAKQLQALVKAGVLASTPGPAGGLALARTPERISFMDVIAAIDGAEPAFRCTHLPPHDGSQRSLRSCAIDVVMRKADLAWRRAMAGETLAELADRVTTAHPGLEAALARALIERPSLSERKDVE